MPLTFFSLSGDSSSPAMNTINTAPSSPIVSTCTTDCRRKQCTATNILPSNTSTANTATKCYNPQLDTSIAQLDTSIAQLDTSIDIIQCVIQAIHLPIIAITWYKN